MFIRRLYPSLKWRNKSYGLSNQKNLMLGEPYTNTQSKKTSSQGLFILSVTLKITN